MISFRFHLVSIVAVFLALGLGVLMGTTVVKQSLIDNLRSRANQAIDTTHSLQSEIKDLRATVHAWEAFGQSTQDLLVGGRLSGRSVVLVTAQGVDSSAVDGVRKALTASDATVTGVVVVTARMALADESSRARLAAVLQQPPSTPAPTLAADAAERLAVRLSTGAPSDGGPDVLQDLTGAGFLAAQDVGPAGQAGVGGADQAVLVVSGGVVAPSTPPEAFLVPFVSELASAGHPVVAGETSTSTYDFVLLLRRTEGVDGRVLTVDDLDTTPGRVAVVLGLESLLNAEPRGCTDFGSKPGACDVIPRDVAVSPTPSPALSP